MERGESGAVVLRELPLNSPSGGVGLELPQALAVASVRPQAHALDSTHSVRSSLLMQLVLEIGSDLVK